MDGTGAEPVAATVLVEGGRIADVLPPGADLSGAEVIDATGNIVAPGFIDLHSHADFSRRRPRRTRPRSCHQGVTTLVTGNCGWSPFPITDLEQMRAGTAFLTPEHDWSWRDTGSFAACAASARLP